ncbi:hypothetical protein CPAST_c26030 [Clostridium pasteurianum DSM 525 = ATCC 6013]|uniref:DUF3606 domain-containing protein n=1 Tax=Clostridium pasteurianum DSM 525 = ATCC 6013 TaxID=1262449 RepID=A0A0H3J417_CLOPA|nr:DUF3606 domain-containing protein [Clostridium pasteurianum]AJA48671.1 hypothetical protein CPAST_c26030 [Clostridium pasteurianum DSM 525 = ATCC 6013]AJA52659.1 hypothetical protein CLPA_c26030 [Clostridium pasteurianum DSM 525 = ATCC 6013]AOZ75899.1 hypothetical protein AQ983_12655 [Clostridium pasteurianum DSM 525 = ATCC 6013]AOZ79695.1 hypothetical protein AQ984_12650 [Clostridium pasteurianum]ELP59971.1 hypothetical protein F502_05027 [Clostridium pasteurianum DSM 525 = ATCC 6013]
MLLFKIKPKRNTYYKTPSDYWTINIFDQEEINWWCKELSCSEQELIGAVNKVGDSTYKVKEYFGEY